MNGPALDPSKETSDLRCPIGLDQWVNWRHEGFTRLPVVYVASSTTCPPTWENFSRSPASVLLESAQSGRFTYLCDRPARLIIGRDRGADVWTGDGAVKITTIAGDPLAVLKNILQEANAPRLPGWPAMSGGLMGVFGYDLVRTCERLPFSAKRDLTLPLYAMIETSELFVYDHPGRTLRIVAWTDTTIQDRPLAELFSEGCAVVNRAWKRWQQSLAATASSSSSNESSRDVGIEVSFTPEAFKAAVRRAKEYIASGDTYQVNLSLRRSQRTDASPIAIYEALRRINPSPYMGLLRMPTFSLVCGSPELLVRLEDGIVRSRPIAGTRPRGTEAVQNARLSCELLANEKERAEHLMLVDLIRNDIGRVAEFGSVHVSEFMAVENYSHVMHIVSQVEGRLASGQSWDCVLRAMFPGGTITGCPKIRTMEIIEELEPVGRGFYTGALGWISYSGEMELNIVIRSMLVHEGVAYVQSGAGIVADSEPDRELDETNRKARALWLALDEATRTNG